MCQVNRGQTIQAHHEIKVFQWPIIESVVADRCAGVIDQHTNFNIPGEGVYPG